MSEVHRVASIHRGSGRISDRSPGVLPIGDHTTHQRPAARPRHRSLFEIAVRADPGFRLPTKSRDDLLRVTLADPRRTAHHAAPSRCSHSPNTPPEKSVSATVRTATN